MRCVVWCVVRCANTLPATSYSIACGAERCSDAPKRQLCIVWFTSVLPTYCSSMSFADLCTKRHTNAQSHLSKKPREALTQSYAPIHSSHVRREFLAPGRLQQCSGKAKTVIRSEPLRFSWRRPVTLYISVAEKQLLRGTVLTP